MSQSQKDELYDRMVETLKLYERTYMRTQVNRPSPLAEAAVMGKVTKCLEDARNIT